MEVEKIVLSKERNVTLTTYLQSVGGEFRNISKRPAILVLPGGGYSMCSDREADPVALAYAEAGYQVFILRYSVGQYAEWPRPLQDYEEAMSLIRSRAEEWSLYPDKIAVIGFSAGGHLAAAAATMSENRPNAAILCYAITDGDSAKFWLASAPDLVSKVDGKTCPCFLFATRNDNTVPISNTIHFMDALDKADVTFESHVYPYGPHGVSVSDDTVLVPGAPVCPRASSWVKDSIGFLHDVFGGFGEGRMTEPKVGARINGNGDAELSVDCTVGYLMSIPAAQAILKPMFDAAAKRAAEEHGDQMPADADVDHSDIANRMTLREALSYARVPAGVLDQMNKALEKIPNPNALN